MLAALTKRPPIISAAGSIRPRTLPGAFRATASAAVDANMSKCKEIREVLRAPPRHWVGNGFHVFPVFHNRAFTKELSPWLMFDYAAPKEFKPSYERRGVGQHPHRGFETITIAFQGEVEHGDSCGNRDVIGPGDVQWMTAARGIIHEEFHSTDFQQTGGTFEMAQLWLNLPAKHKMDPPKYQPIVAKDIPVVPLKTSDEADAAKLSGENSIRVIAGDEATYGVKGAATTHTPVELLDVRMATDGVSSTSPSPTGTTPSSSFVGAASPWAWRVSPWNNRAWRSCISEEMCSGSAPQRQTRRCCFWRESPSTSPSPRAGPSS